MKLSQLIRSPIKGVDFLVWTIGVPSISEMLSRSLHATCKKDSAFGNELNVNGFLKPYATDCLLLRMSNSWFTIDKKDAVGKAFSNPGMPAS